MNRHDLRYEWNEAKQCHERVEPKAMKNGNCPTCGMPIESGEKLIAYYHEPRDWWVSAHLGPQNGHDVSFADGAIILTNMKIICQQARFATPRMIGDSYQGPG